MANIIDYLTWRGDLSMKQDPCNPVDNLVLSQLGYVLWDDIVSDDFHNTITLEEAIGKFFISGQDQFQLENGYYASEELNKMLSLLLNCPRFGKMRLCGYESRIDYAMEKQFAAMTFLLEDDTAFVIYRGTDGSFVGWKEDFNMSFMTTIPSQIDAAHYLEKMHQAYPDKKIRVGGHSKGGNLAVYAGVFAQDVQDSILEIYNNDGPGFMEATIQTEEYQKMESRIKTYVPQSSIVGMILEHEEAYIIVHSEHVGPFQHDAFTWEVERGQFIYLDEVTNTSRVLDKAMKDWMESLTAEQKEKFMDTIYDLITESGIKNTKEFKSNWFKNGINVLKSLRDIDEETKQMVSEGFSLFFKATQNSLPKVNINFPTEINLPKLDLNIPNLPWNKKEE